MFYYFVSQRIPEKEITISEPHTDLDEFVREIFTNAVVNYSDAGELFAHDKFELMEYEEETDNETILDDYKNWDNVIELLPPECSEEEYAIAEIFNYTKELIEKFTDETVKETLKESLINKFIEMYENLN